MNRARQLKAEELLRIHMPVPNFDPKYFAFGVAGSDRTLTDNDGISDQHKPPFSGTIDWERLCQLIARSAYKKPISMEVVMRNTSFTDAKLFLKECFEAGSRLSRMVEEHQMAKRS